MTFYIGADGRDGFFRQIERGLFVSDEELRRRADEDEAHRQACLATFTVDTTANHVGNPPGQFFPPAEQPKFKPLPAHRRIHGQRKGKERRW